MGKNVWRFNNFTIKIIDRIIHVYIYQKYNFQLTKRFNNQYLIKHTYIKYFTNIFTPNADK